VRTARAFPEMRFVIEHIAKPDILNREIEAWSRGMAPFAGLPNVACKLSGMVTEADLDGWTANDLRPYVSRVLEWFGEDRVMFGSDWPVCLVAGADYGRVKSAIEEALGAIPGTTHRKVFGDNARAVYRLPVAEA
jgi:L-fuconolactonase